MKRSVIFYCFLCVVFLSVNVAANFSEEEFLRIVTVERQRLKDKLSNVTSTEKRAEIYDQFIQSMKGPAYGSNSFILQVWAEDLLQEAPMVVEAAMNKLSKRSGGFRQDILSFIAVAIETAPGRVYVPNEVIDMLQMVGMWKSDYKNKLRQGPSLSSNSEECYYTLLAISPGASSGEIKEAYRKAAMRFHPDRNPGDPSTEGKFKSRKEAYETLIDPNRRRTYDREHGFL